MSEEATSESRRRRRAAAGPTPKRLTGLELHEVSVVDAPANVGSRHLLTKTDAPDPGGDSAPNQGEEVAALRRRIAEAEAAHADNQAAIALLTEQLLAAGPAPAAPAAAPPPPARTAREEADIHFSALALIGGSTPEKGSRSFWRDQINSLGRHLLPGEPPTRQVAAALDDPRGQVFVTALQSQLA